MSYRTILVHVDQSKHAAARMRYAAALAHAHGARLVGAAMFGVAREVFPHGYDARPDTLCADLFQPLADQARAALARFETIAAERQAEHESRFVCDGADQGLALLRRTSHVSLALLSAADASGPELRADQPDLLRFLARHHVTPTIVLRQAGHDSGRQLLDLAQELGCGLLAMGCYGHSRFRELCLGGASRTVLRDAAIPLLLAH